MIRRSLVLAGAGLLCLAAGAAGAADPPPGVRPAGEGPAAPAPAGGPDPPVPPAAAAAPAKDAADAGAGGEAASDAARKRRRRGSRGGRKRSNPRPEGAADGAGARSIADLRARIDSLQLALLDAPPAPGPGDALVLVHVLNPYGMAWLRRTNENNVDLNRNFLLDGGAYASSSTAVACRSCTARSCTSSRPPVASLR